MLLFNYIKNKYRNKMTKIQPNTHYQNTSNYPSHLKTVEMLRIRGGGGSGKRKINTTPEQQTAKKAKKVSISHDEINTLLNGKEFGFQLKQSNITSIYGNRNGSIDIYKKIVDCICENKDTLNNFIVENKIFSHFKNISSILNGAGNNAPKALTELLKVLTDKKDAITNSGLTTQNISSILSGAGKNAPKALTEFLTDNNINNLKLLNKKYHKLLKYSGIKAPERIKNLLIIQEYQTQNTPTTITEILDKIDNRDTGLINGLKKFFQKNGLNESSQINLATYDFDALKELLGDEIDAIHADEIARERNNNMPQLPQLNSARLSPVNEYQGGFLNDGNHFHPLPNP